MSASKYKSVRGESSHGIFTIADDDEDDMDEIQLTEQGLDSGAHHTDGLGLDDVDHNATNAKSEFPAAKIERDDTGFGHTGTGTGTVGTGTGTGANTYSPIDELFREDVRYRDAGWCNQEYLLHVLPRVWRLITFSWMKPLLETGNSRRLEPEDLYTLGSRDMAPNVYRAFAEQWTKQLDKHERATLKGGSGAADSSKSQPSLAVALLSAFGGPFFAAGGLKFIYDSLQFVGCV